MRNVHKAPLTSGSIAKHTVRLTIPVLIAMSFQTLFSLTDLYFVGQLGGRAVAAVSLSMTAFFVVLTLSHAVGVGALALISQAWGRAEFDHARHVFIQVLWLILAIGGSLALTAFLGAELYMSFFSNDAETIALGLAYFKPYALTFLLHTFLMVNGFCFRGSGDFITPTKIITSSIILNIVLDPCLIFGVGPFPELGIRGAAYASIISQALAVIAYGWILSSQSKNLYLSGSLKPSAQLLKEILRIGIPSGFQYLILAAMMGLTYRWVKPLGPFTVAAIGIGFRLLHASYLPMISFSIATSTLVGQNWGAQLIDRAKTAYRCGLLYANSWAVLITTAFIIFPGFFLGFFASEEQVIQDGTVYLRIFGVSNYFIATIIVATAVFQGLGKTVPPMIGAAIKLLIYGGVWMAYSQSTNLYLIYGVAVIAIILEFAWDLIWVKGAMRLQKVI